MKKYILVPLMIISLHNSLLIAQQFDPRCIQATVLIENLQNNQIISFGTGFLLANPKNPSKPIVITCAHLFQTTTLAVRMNTDTTFFASLASNNIFFSSDVSSPWSTYKKSIRFFINLHEKPNLNYIKDDSLDIGAFVIYIPDSITVQLIEWQKEDTLYIVPLSKISSLMTDSEKKLFENYAQYINEKGDTYISLPKSNRFVSKKYGVQIVPPIKMGKLKPRKMKLADQLPIKLDMIQYRKDLALGDDIYFSGFPFGFGVKDLIEPIVRSGTIAWLSRDQNEKKFFLDAFSYGGNSGSPIFLKRFGSTVIDSKYEKSYLIGMIRGHKGQKIENILTAQDTVNTGTIPVTISKESFDINWGLAECIYMDDIIKIWEKAQNLEAN